MSKMLLEFPHKKIRSEVIKKYTEEDYDKILVFSCGNAGRALEELDLNVLHIGEEGIFQTEKWFSLKEIKHYFYDYFDATSGHLNIELMMLIGEAFKSYLGDLPDTVYVPTGSGETLICLKLAYPQVNFIAVYNLGKETEYHPEAPLNKLVELLSGEIILNGKEVFKEA